MIPGDIGREHILKAIHEVRRVGVPEGRGSRKFLLVFEGKDIPPKYAISLANKYANGKELNPEEFSGGNESNEFLRRLGFTIRQVKGTNNAEKPAVKHLKEHQLREYSHSERCPKCKETVHAILEKIYGNAERGHKLEVGATPEAFRNTPYYQALREIFEVLQKHRGFKEFAKASTLPNCDFFMSDPGLVVEFDESQHFTLPRKIALEHYPENLELGFGRKKWIRLSKTINAKDDDPPYRDEQRAWYDTLRDFLPALTGLKPTIRLFSKDFKWCSLKPGNPSDVQHFKVILRGNLDGGEMEMRDSSDPTIGRIIIAKPWDGNLEQAKRLLEDIYKKWPKEKGVKLLITCGGFIQFEWPKSVGWEKIGDNKSPNKEAVGALIREAEKCARQVLSEGLGEKLSKVTDYITLGIDSYKDKISRTQAYISELHIETVFLANLKTNQLHWTGKSYPTPGQQNGLVRITDLKTHFVTLDGIGKAMILGCHDLTMFNNRNMDNTGKWRRDIKETFRRLADEEKPAIVLHHPHTTVTTGTWRNGWSTIRKTLHSVKGYAGAGRYCEADRPKQDYDPIKEVLEATRKGNTIDFIKGAA